MNNNFTYFICVVLVLFCLMATKQVTENRVEKDMETIERCSDLCGELPIVDSSEDFCVCQGVQYAM